MPSCLVAPVALFPWFPCCLVAQLPCCPVALLPGCPCCPVALLPWLPCCLVPLLPCCPVALLLWLPWLPCCLVALLPFLPCCPGCPVALLPWLSCCLLSLVPRCSGYPVALWPWVPFCPAALLPLLPCCPGCPVALLLWLPFYLAAHISLAVLLPRCREPKAISTLDICFWGFCTLEIDWAIMMTIRPSRFITMKTVTAFKQALHLMHQSNPTAPRTPGQSSGISFFWALDGNSGGKKCMHWIWLMHQGYREK